MKMKRYRIETGRYGGELTVGRVTIEFAKQYAGNQEVLEEIVGELEEYDNVIKEGHPVSWYDVDDVVHINAPYSDNTYAVYEIDGVGEDVAEIGSFEYNHVYGRECYINEELSEDADTISPMLVCHSQEKGSFGEIILEIEDEFDPDLLAVTTVETDLCELIDNYFYDGVELEVNYDYCDSIGKGFSAYCGYAPDWFDEDAEKDAQWLKESVEEYYASLNE